VSKKGLSAGRTRLPPSPSPSRARRRRPPARQPAPAPPPPSERTQGGPSDGRKSPFLRAAFSSRRTALLSSPSPPADAADADLLFPARARAAVFVPKCTLDIFYADRDDCEEGDGGVDGDSVNVAAPLLSFPAGRLIKAKRGRRENVAAN